MKYDDYDEDNPDYGEYSLHRNCKPGFVTTKAFLTGDENKNRKWRAVDSEIAFRHASWYPNQRSVVKAAYKWLHGSDKGQKDFLKKVDSDQDAQTLLRFKDGRTKTLYDRAYLFRLFQEDPVCAAQIKSKRVRDWDDLVFQMENRMGITGRITAVFQ